FAAGYRMGYESLLSSAQVRKATPICLRLLTQLIRWARALARARAGSNIAANIAMIAITTSNSMRVKARKCFRKFFIDSTGLLVWFCVQPANFIDHSSRSQHLSLPSLSNGGANPIFG